MTRIIDIANSKLVDCERKGEADQKREQPGDGCQDIALLISRRGIVSVAVTNLPSRIAAATGPARRHPTRAKERVDQPLTEWSHHLSTLRGRYLLIGVIFDPSRPRPAISPFWPNGKAYTSFASVVEVVLIAAPLSTTTTLGPEPIAQPLLFLR